MTRLFAMLFLAGLSTMSASPAGAADPLSHPLGRLELGDAPYWPGIQNREGAIEAGCWRWNWQQRSWYDLCPVYLEPKAYLRGRPVTWR